MGDMVNHPQHYVTKAGIEAIDVIEQYGLGYHLGNAIKYLLRAGRKGDATAAETDLAKALWYIKRAMLLRYDEILLPSRALVPVSWRAVLEAFEIDCTTGRGLAVKAILVFAGHEQSIADGIPRDPKMLSSAVRHLE